MRRVFVATCLTGLASCLFPALDGLTDGDASAPNDATTGDASTDVSNDVATTETSTDAGADVKPPFCAAYAEAGANTFCEDFDSISDVTQLNAAVTSNVTVSLDTVDFASPPASLSIDIASSDSGAPLHGVVNYSTNVIASTLTLDFDVRVPSVATSPANVMALSFSNGSREILLVLVNTGLFIEEATPPVDGGSGLYNHPTIAFTWDKAWHHIKLSVSMTTKTTSLAIDGTTRENAYAFGGNWANGAVRLAYGVLYTPTGPWSIDEDNVLLQLVP